MPDHCSHMARKAQEEIGACCDESALEALRVKYLGRKGAFADLMARIPTLEVSERKAFGAALNAAKKDVEEALQKRQAELKAQGSKARRMDTSLPGKGPLLGRLHPLTQVQNEICDVFSHLGFKVFKGPQIETEFNNFEALNIPLEHPSRDAFDTFYMATQEGRSVSDANGQKLLLRF